MDMFKKELLTIVSGSFLLWKGQTIMKNRNDQKKYPKTTSGFQGTYYFLSNFYPAPVSYMGQIYANSEAAFQAQKTLSAKERQRFGMFRMHSAAEAKKLGKKLELRPDWEKIKLQCMYEICMCKFMQNPDLRKALLDTGSCILVEENTWGDSFWGTVNGYGENQLGQILMDIRAKLQWDLTIVNTQYV